MAIAHVQSGGADGGGTSGIDFVPLGSNVTSGNVVVVGISWNSSTVTLTSIASSRGDNLTLLHNPSLMEANGFRYALAYGAATSTGTLTLTATFSSAPVVVGVLASEYSGVDTTTPTEDSDATAVFIGGTGTDAYAGSTVTSTSASALIWGVGLDLNVGDSLTTGTGYTGRVTAMDTSHRGEIEDKVLVSAGNTTVTFTSSNGFLELGIGTIVLKPAGGGGGSAIAPISYHYTQQGIR